LWARIFILRITPVFTVIPRPFCHAGLSTAVPDSVSIPFADVLHAYNGFEASWGSVGLRPKMELRVENSYFQEGMPKRAMDGFLGTEIARYEVRPQGGLRLGSVHSMEKRPRDQPPVERLIPASQRDYRYQRFYFEVGFNRNGDTRSSVLLGANSMVELDRLASQMASDSDSICNRRSANCTVFPEACSVSVDIEVVINGVRRSVLWGSVLRSVAEGTRHLELQRLYEGKLTPVTLDPLDPNALRLPLLPGDHLKVD
jgi:hypothetical protein